MGDVALEQDGVVTVEGALVQLALDVLQDLLINHNLLFILSLSFGIKFSTSGRTKW